MVCQKILLLCGGPSEEHFIALRSAKHIAQVLDQQLFALEVVYITQQGLWFHWSVKALCALADETLPNLDAYPQVHLVPGSAQGFRRPCGQFIEVDCVFPMLHGTYGEDGVIQGLLQAMQVPYVGAEILASALCMDKVVAKAILRAHKVPVLPDYVVQRMPASKWPDLFQTLCGKWSLPWVVKPASQGSSMGVSIVRAPSDFKTALDAAFRLDQKVLIEPFVTARELEVPVLGGKLMRACVAGEIICHQGVYSYDRKYHQDQSATTQVPAVLSEQEQSRLQALALEVCQILTVEGLARVDFFMKENGNIYINEVNTMPGFTSISLFPKLWRYSGLDDATLVTQLIEDACERFVRKKKHKALLTSGAQA